jgi:1,2-phenylacetyl-CoA epoxidase catalytic subunit
MTANQNIPAMSGEEFVATLTEENNAALERLGNLSAAGEPGETLTVEKLLRLALKNELEASELAAIWMPTTEEIDVKLALARQAGDEAKHYRLIAERLKALGVDADAIDPRQGGYSPLFNYLRDLRDTAARVAAGQFTREGIALIRNQRFIEYCESVGDHETAALYRDQIQKDERHHHELGRQLLARYAVTSEQQQAARQAARRCLELAEEIQEMARLRAGISRAPGC